MRPNDHYLALDGTGRPETQDSPANSVAQFLTLCLLGARDEVGFPSNEAGFDEDVNVYLVGLLANFLGSQYHAEATRYVQPRDIDLARELRRRDDDRHSFRVYKVNADHLLLAIGLLHRVEGGQGIGVFRREPGDFSGRASTYYDLASSSLRRLRRRSTGTELAMTKLSRDFDRYAGVLRCVRSSYFHLTSRIGEGTLFHLEQASRQAPPIRDRAELYDLFLDAYSAWQDERTERRYQDLADAVEGLREADPEFAFRMPDAPD